MFESLLLKLERVRRAETVEEREAVYRFRYRIYVEELSKQVPNADHVKKWIRDDEDEDASTAIFYTGDVNAVTGTIRLESWAPGGISERARQLFRTSMFPRIDTLRTAELSRLVVNKSLRGKLIVPALVCAAFEEMCKRDVALIFGYCAPGLVGAYRRLGLRPYSADLVQIDDGLRVPLVGVLSDLEYLKRMNSPVLSIARDYFGPGRRAPLDLSGYESVLGSKMAVVETDPQSVWRRVQEDLIRHDDEATRLLHRVSDEELKKLTDKGFLLDVVDTQVVTKENLVEREMFVILEGAFEVTVEDKRVAVLRSGEVFGELALLLESGRRTASIRAMTSGRLLVLRRNFIEELVDEDPALASRLLLNLSRVLADRLARLIQQA